MSGDSPSGRVLSQEDMREPLELPLPFGTALLYSARAPDKEGPNEDAAAVFSLDASRGMLAVADGMGGQPAGAQAAQLALEALEGAAAAAAAQEGPLRPAILDAFEQANQSVLAMGTGSAATLAVAEIDGDHLRVYHAGDSAALVVGQRGRLKLQTVSHSPVGYAVESGMLDEDEAMHHDERHLVSNQIGSSDMRVELGSPLRLAARDTVLLASDGLLDNLSLLEIVELIRRGPLMHAAELLVEGARSRMLSPRQGEPSKPDDCTFVLFRPGVRAPH